MRRWSRLLLPALCVAAPSALQSCNTAGFNAVSIRPIYGWVDGCTPVRIGGSGFEDDVKVMIGNAALENALIPVAEGEDTDPNVRPLDVGYQVTGTTPSGTTPGYVDVKVTSGDNEKLIGGGFYYEACPLVAYPEFADPAEGVTAGTTITLGGCNLMPDYQVKVGGADAVPVAVTEVCKTATVSFTAPAVDTAVGTGWYVTILDSSGAQLYPDPSYGCDTTLPVETSQAVTSDTGTYDPCYGLISVTYATGGA